MMGSEHLGLSLRIAAVVVPVAVYFLVLGLLNSRRHPQLLSGRLDFALLIAALSPLFVLPALGLAGITPASVFAAVAALALAVVLLAPRGRAWVIYNMPANEAREAIASALRSMGVAFKPAADVFHLMPDGATVHVGGFPLLRNVSVRLRGGSGRLTCQFQRALAANLGSVNAQTSPMAAGLLLVATGMIVAPLAFMVERVPEIVRLLTDILH